MYVHTYKCAHTHTQTHRVTHSLVSPGVFSILQVQEVWDKEVLLTYLLPNSSSTLVSMRLSTYEKCFFQCCLLHKSHPKEWMEVSGNRISQKCQDIYRNQGNFGLKMNKTSWLLLVMVWIWLLFSYHPINFSYSQINSWTSFRSVGRKKKSILRPWA